MAIVTPASFADMLVTARQAADLPRLDNGAFLQIARENAAAPLEAMRNAQAMVKSAADGKVLREHERRLQRDESEYARRFLADEHKYRKDLAARGGLPGGGGSSNKGLVAAALLPELAGALAGSLSPTQRNRMAGQRYVDAGGSSAGGVDSLAGLNQIVGDLNLLRRQIGEWSTGPANVLMGATRS